MAENPTQSTTDQPVADDPKDRRRPNRRSPNFPYLNLEAAIDRVRQLYEHEHRNAAPLSVVAGHWDYSAKSSSNDKVIAALAAYGLVAISGKGDQRELKVSDRGLDIVEDERPDSEDRERAIRTAALAPSIHQELREKYGSDLPSDATMRTHLIRDRNFNPKAVGTVIANYRSTVEYARLDNVQPDSKDNGDIKIEVGSFVQWTSGERAQFKEPKEVTRLSEDGRYAFVKGERTGVLVEELSLEQPPMTTTLTNPKPAAGPPPPNPDYVGEFGKQPNDLPLPLPMPDGTIRVVPIPRMNAKTFSFFKTQLEAYQTAIVLPEESTGSDTNEGDE